MSLFETPKWESSSIGDHVLKGLFYNKPQKAASGSQRKSKSTQRTVVKNKLKTVIPDKNKAIKKAFRLLESGDIALNKNKKKGKGKPHQLVSSKAVKAQNKEKSVENKLNENASICAMQPVVQNKKIKKKKKSQTIASTKDLHTSKQNQINRPQQSNSVIKIKKKKKHKGQVNESGIQEEKTSQKITKKEQFKIDRNMTTAEQTDSVNKKSVSLRERMIEKLKGARFRYLNEQMYTNQGKQAKQFFEKDKDAYKAYHIGYRQQVTKWPINPVDVIIRKIKKLPRDKIVADFGCGEAKLATSVPQKVHSFDLVAANEHVTPCDMSHTPLEPASVDVTVFCLSLMGTNLNDYIIEANRVLKLGGMLKIAEVDSRLENVDIFVKSLKVFGFSFAWKNLSHNLFYFLDFKKVADVKKKKSLPQLTLKPCLYKKR